ncbi:MAG: efflux RND transporter permease subunit [Lewinellaceae bacterium]|nr:efflux RND transporter permease subunit [Lewinellaceae bacterium]
MEPLFVQLAQFGITPANLQYQLQTVLEGNVVGKLYEPEQLSDIRLVYPNNRNLSIEEFRALQIFLPNGKLKPITELAEISLDEGEAEIERENLQMIGVVSGRLDNRDLGSVMRDIQKSIPTQVSLAPGYHIQYGGAFAEQQQSFRELLRILIIASLLVFGAILFFVSGYPHCLTDPFCGGFGDCRELRIAVFDAYSVKCGAYTGLIMIVGIIGENAIFTFLQFRETLEGGKTPEDAVVYAISTRLRPKLMTALGAIIALTPLALGIGTGAPLHQPLAIAVIGGFLAALPLLLIVLPTGIFLLYGGKSQRQSGSEKRKCKCQFKTT